MNDSKRSCTEQPTTPVRVIVADDDEHLRKAVAAELRDMGYECVAKDDGAAALKALDEGDFDVALVDLDMPGIDVIPDC